MKRYALGLLLLGLFSTASFSQQWHTTGSLSTPKRFVTLTTLDNGKVLMTGGINTDQIPHRECELFDPAAGTWSLTDSLKIGRILHTVVKLQDGRVAVFGGQISGAYDGGVPVQTNVVEIYDPSTGAWTDGGQLQLARQHQTTSLLTDGKILVAGGLNGYDPVASAEIYDPATKTSTLVASMHQARYEHQATSLSDGRVMVTGGRIGGWDGVYFNEAEIYDPVTNTWTVVDPMHQSRMRGLLVQFSDGSILSAAGRNTPTSTAPGSELFDLSSGHWTSTDSMKVPCTWLACVLFPDDRYLATGGFIDATWTSSTDVLCTPTCEWYDKSNARWFYAPSLNQARGEHAAAFVHQTSNEALPEDMILVAGGITGNNTFTNTAEVLDVGMRALNAYKAMPNNQLAAVTSRRLSNALTVEMNGTSTPIISYSLPATGDVTIRLISLAGRVVRSYAAGMLAPGSYELALSHEGLASGCYLVQLQIDGRPKANTKVVIGE